MDFQVLVQVSLVDEGTVAKVACEEFFVVSRVLAEVALVGIASEELAAAEIAGESGGYGPVLEYVAFELVGASCDGFVASSADVDLLIASGFFQRWFLIGFIHNSSLQKENKETRTKIKRINENKNVNRKKTC